MCPRQDRKTKIMNTFQKSVNNLQIQTFYYCNIAWSSNVHKFFCQTKHPWTDLFPKDKYWMLQTTT